MLGYVVIYTPAILFVIGCLILCFLGVSCKKVTDPALNHVDSLRTKVYCESRGNEETRDMNESMRGASVMPCLDTARYPRLGVASPADGYSRGFAGAARLWHILTLQEKWRCEIRVSEFHSIWSSPRDYWMARSLSANYPELYTGFILYEPNRRKQRVVEITPEPKDGRER